MSAQGERKKKRVDGQISGMEGVFLVAAKLASRGFIVSPTSRSAAGVDLLVTGPSCKQAFSVQVKAQRKNPSFWLVGARAKEHHAADYIYVLVNLNDGNPLFFVVPSEDIAEKTIVETSPRTSSVWYSFKRDEAYRENWAVFGEP